jgi:hypothetical protein
MEQMKVGRETYWIQERNHKFRGGLLGIIFQIKNSSKCVRTAQAKQRTCQHDFERTVLTALVLPVIEEPASWNNSTNSTRNCQS